MSAITIDYRVTVYDSDDTTPLTPIGGAAHADAFKYSTCTVTGFQPYLMASQFEPRQGIDVLTGRSEIGEDVCRILDKRTGTSNVIRHVTAFAGDEEGRARLQGKKYVKEQRVTIDGTAGSWTDYFTGRIAVALTPDPSVEGPIYTIVARSERAQEKRDVFIGVPHNSVAYAHPCPLLPIGVQEQWGWAKPVDRLTGKIASAGISSSRLVNLTGTNGGVGALVTKRAFLTSALQKRADFIVQDSNGNWFCPHVRVRLTRSDTSATGDFWLAPVTKAGGLSYDGKGFSPLFITNGEGAPIVLSFGIRELPSTHPNHMALPAADVACTFYLYNAGPPSDDAPLLIDDIDIGTLVEDLNAGKFSTLNDSGTASDDGDGAVAVVPIPTDATTFGALAADIPLFRGSITKVWKLAQFLPALSQASHVFFRSNGSGEVEAKDIRLSSVSATGLGTVGNADVISAEWEQGRDTVGKIIVKSYQDSRIENFDLSGETVADPAHGYRSSPQPKVYLTRRAGIAEAADLPIDAMGIRHHATFADRSDLPLAPENDTTREAFVAGLYKQLFGDGAAYVRANVRYTDNTKNLSPGDLTLVNVDAIPNLASNERGGVRVMLVVEAQRNSTGFAHRYMDCGADSVATVPVIGTPAQDAAQPKHGITLAVTLNATGEGVQYETAYTDTATSTRPTTGWSLRDDTQSSGTFYIGANPSNTRVWVRARTVSPNKLPSSYAHPTGTGYVDTAALTAPSALDTEVNGTAVILTWTNGEDDCVVIPTLDGVDHVARPLPTGSTRFVFEGLNPSTEYDFGVRHRDPFGGTSATTEVTETTGTAGALADPLDIEVAQGSDVPFTALAGRTDVAFVGYGVELQLMYSDPQTKAHIEGSVNSDFSTIDVDLEAEGERVKIMLPPSATKYYFRWAQVRDGWTESAPSEVVSSYPVPILPIASSKLRDEAKATIQVDAYYRIDTLWADIIVNAKWKSFRWAASDTAQPSTITGSDPVVVLTAGTIYRLDTGINSIAVAEQGYLTLKFYTDDLGTQGGSVLIKKAPTRGIADDLADSVGALKLSAWRTALRAAIAADSIGVGETIPIDGSTFTTWYVPSTNKIWVWDESAAEWVIAADGDSVVAGSIVAGSQVVGYLHATALHGDVASFITVTAESAFIAHLTGGSAEFYGTLVAVDGDFSGTVKGSLFLAGHAAVRTLTVGGSNNPALGLTVCSIGFDPSGQGTGSQGSITFNATLNQFSFSTGLTCTINSGTLNGVHTGTGEFTNLSMSDGTTMTTISIGAAGTGPGGSGRMLYLA